ncbi:MAG: TetR/AcrR family transcriptional regulator [Chloroflexaceae bacterium]|jgi:AcrR family transcriptional regulator|nr:TetR/AcrR family transcriptional regulator [Chloroflexaceae bacterium]
MPRTPREPRETRLRQGSRQRREHEKQELRQAIRDAAATLFETHGYEGFSLRQVAEEVGYTPTTIYLYFADKDALLFEIADEGFVRFGEQIHTAAAAVSNPVERLWAIGHAYLAFAEQNPVYYQLMFMQRSDFLLAKREGERRPRIDVLGIVRETVQAGMDDGLIRPGDAATFADGLWAVCHGIAALRISKLPFTAERASAAADMTLGAMLAGMRPATG